MGVRGVCAMTDPWRDRTRVEAARVGVAAARKVLQIERAGDRYFVGAEEFTSWEKAIAFVLAQDEGE